MNDIVDLTDRFSEIIDDYRDETFGGLLDMDSWASEDLTELATILELVTVLRVDMAIDAFEEADAEDDYDAMYSEYEDLS